MQTSTASPVVPLERPRTRVAVIGGGIMGISLAYALARKGIAADVFEASPVIGGLAGPITLEDGTEVDRFYHAILSSDSALRALCDELGISDRLRFRQTRSAFFVDGGMYSMNSLTEFLLFKALSPLDRIRLGTMIARAQWQRDWEPLERVELRDWLVRLGGRSLFDRLWGPMLEAKFDGPADGIRATWMWARIVRTKSTRAGANQREESGHLIGGYKTLLVAMAAAIERAGGRVRLRTPVQRVDTQNGRVTGVVVDGVPLPYDQVVLTMQGPLAARLLASSAPEYVARLDAIQYLGIVCPLMVLDRPLTGTWVVNIADKSVPLTGVIETTSYIDPSYTGNHHLVYLPKYTAPGSDWLTLPDDEIRRRWLATLGRMFPSFDPASVRYFLVHRERYVEPLHLVGGPPLPGMETPVQGLYMATTAQIYPALTNGESVARHAGAAADLMARQQVPA